MAYSTDNPPQKVASGVGGGGRTLWVYYSADAHADVDAADYFTNAEDLGMSVGDPIIVISSGANLATIHAVSAVDADGATISAAVLT